jgi:hypothetical protein
MDPFTIAGILGVEDSDTTFVNTVGQEAIYDAIGQITEQLNADLERISRLFIGKTTESFKFRYFMNGVRKLQRMGGLGNPAERRVGGSYDVALPIFQFGDALGGNWIDMAYMTVGDVDRQMSSIADAAKRTLRDEILIVLFNNTSYTFEDERNGSLTIYPLANNDSTKYPPLPGSSTPAVANHYSESGYTVANITDTNDPIKTIANKLLARYPYSKDPVVLIGDDMVDKVKLLTDFDGTPDPRKAQSPLADRLVELPDMVPGKIIGRCDNAWVSQWSEMPATYTIGIVPDAEPPIQTRVDPAETGLPRTLTLVKTSDLHPLEKSEWVWRFGLGVTNRLNGVVMEVSAGGGYTIPADYARV